MGIHTLGTWTLEPLHSYLYHEKINIILLQGEQVPRPSGNLLSIIPLMQIVTSIGQDVKTFSSVVPQIQGTIHQNLQEFNLLVCQLKAPKG